MVKSDVFYAELGIKKRRIVIGIWRNWNNNKIALTF